MLLDKDASKYENKSREISEENDNVFNLPEVNLRATVLSFYIGSGPHDVDSTLSLFCLLLSSMLRSFFVVEFDTVMVSVGKGIFVIPETEETLVS